MSGMGNKIFDFTVNCMSALVKWFTVVTAMRVKPSHYTYVWVGNLLCNNPTPESLCNIGQYIRKLDR